VKLQILEFINLLRKAGLKLTTTEVIDSLNAVKLLGFEKELYYIGLQSTLVKEKKDMPVFDKIFNLYFNHRSQTSNLRNNYHNQGLGAIEKKAGLSDGRGLASTAAGGGTPDLLQALLSKDSNLIIEHFHKVIEERDSVLLGLDTLNNIDDIVRQTQIQMEWFMVVNKLERMKEQEEISVIDYYYSIEDLNYLKETLKNMLEMNFIVRFGKEALKKIAEKENIYKTNFVDLKGNQIEELQIKIVHLGKKLATRKSRRYRKANRGKVNIKKVVKNSLPYGGIPIKLNYLNKKMARPSLILLCDISGSVAQFSSFMLQLIYLSQRLFKDVSLFVFVDHLVEVTGLFKNYDLEEVLSELPYLTEVTETGYSHFGNTFREFCESHLHIVNDKSTVIILGDGKNNWRPSGIEYLSKIRDKCHRLYWLNPQPIGEWNNRDSIIKEYARYCHKVFECRNMDQLEIVVKKVF